MKEGNETVDSKSNIEPTPEVPVQCDNCSEVFKSTEVKSLWETPDLCYRITPGSEVPHGECPDCSSFVYLLKKTECEGFLPEAEGPENILKAPLKFEQARGIPTVFGGLTDREGATIALVMKYRNKINSQANADLLKAAPEMLRTLQRMDAGFDKALKDGDPIMNRLNYHHIRIKEALELAIPGKEPIPG